MNNKGIIITLSVTLGVTLLGVMIALIVFIVTTNIYATQLENMYKRNYYEPIFIPTVQWPTTICLCCLLVITK